MLGVSGGCEPSSLQPVEPLDDAGSAPDLGYTGESRSWEPLPDEPTEGCLADPAERDLTQPDQPLILAVAVPAPGSLRRGVAVSAV
jgi:hypothetical protein